ncbi:hypothetical protein MSNKSG1_15297 [Marinobacter santoriniensis NKSG1]|uniref:Uncharacterized protein n=1 Tax=Marinobacter santoriniensis NKSG1 TaxID=1288826 RepID=M7DAJ6_9GAMM|nr:hypothetical protein MSNKSG1_15297 [Marinobacter santoriniensis NKSG1]
MTLSRIVTGLLIILMLVSGPSVGAIPGHGSLQHASSTASQGQGCGAQATRLDSRNQWMWGGCESLEQSHCMISVQQCMSLSVAGLLSPLQLPSGASSDGERLPHTTIIYQSPLLEVLTPPPDLLS